MIARGAAAARTPVRQHDRRRGVRTASRRTDGARRCGIGAGRRRRRALGRAARSGEGRGSRSRGGRCRAIRGFCSCWRRRPGSDSARKARRRARRACRVRRRHRVGEARRALRRCRRLRAPLRREPWAVVVNEAAACGLPLVLGSSAPLAVFSSTARTASSCPPATSTGCPRLRAPLLRIPRCVAGARCARASSPDWGYRPVLESFPAAVREAAAGCPPPCPRMAADRESRPEPVPPLPAGVEATAHLLTELCEALAEEYDVEVVTGVLHGPRGRSAPGRAQGVRIVRVASTSFERSALGRRALNYVSYLGSARPRALGSAAGLVHDGPADHRLTSRPRRSARRSARPRHQSGRLSGDRDGLTV